MLAVGLRKSILKIMLLFLEVFLMTEEYLRSLKESNFIEVERLQLLSISSSLNSVKENYRSVWQWLLILITEDWFLGMEISVYFFLMGWSPSWYLSGSTELTLLISKNLKFRTGFMTSLYSLGYYRYALRLWLFRLLFFWMGKVSVYTWGA